jgi:hypothetical protein
VSWPPNPETHKRFTVSKTAYMRNQSREQMKCGEWWAIHYQDAPTPGTLEGSWNMSMRWPTLIIADYVENPEEMGAKVARILEKHWDDESEEPS